MEATEQTKRVLLTEQERRSEPGWLVEMVDRGNLDELRFAARNCPRGTARMLANVITKLEK